MANVIRNLSHRPLNLNNQWPVSGLFIHQHYGYNTFERRWFSVSVDALPFIMGHVFEQTYFKTVIFTLNIKIHHTDVSRSLIDICIEDLADIAVPIEVLERHDLKDDLLTTLRESSDRGNAYIKTTLHCYVKGWFW